MTISEELASRITMYRFENVPSEGISSAKIAILDTLGVMLGGAQEQATLIVHRILEGGRKPGTSLILGTGHRTTCLDAALINGTSAHALDFDDVSDAMGGHPSAPVLAALLALGEEVDATGKQILCAFIIGFETEIRIGRAVNFYHYNKGWHPTSTLGVFGAAAASARLLDLSKEHVATALSLSVSMAAGVKANFGTMTKPLHVGNCARSGLFAALLASKGFTAGLDAFEHKQGFLNVFNAPGTFDTGKIFDHWADPLEIVCPGVAIKLYPCCASTHAAVDALIQIIDANRIAPESVSRIDAWIHERRLEHTNRPDPQSSMAAKFSLQYCLARALIHGKVVLEHFEGQAFEDPRTQSIMKRVKAAPYTAEQFNVANADGAKVKITLCDGRVFSAKLDGPLGQSATNPLSLSSLRLKFENCAGRILDGQRILELRNAVEHLDQLSSIRKLTALTEPLRTYPIIEL